MFRPVDELAALVRSGELSARELVAHSLGRIEELDSKLGAFMQIDRDGGALRYRGVDIEELAGSVPYERVWGLLVDGKFEPGLALGERVALPLRTGDVRVDLQAALATLGASWGLSELIDIDDAQAREDLARLSAAALSFVAQSARVP